MFRGRDEKRTMPRMVPVIRRRSEDGDTLIEVLVALVVLGLASVSLLVAFGTVISASAEHRSLANQNLALQTAAQTIIAAVQNDPPVFNCVVAAANYPDYQSGLQETEGGKTYSINYSTTAPIQYWSSTSNNFSASYACAIGAPQLLTIQLIGTGVTSQSLSFVVAQAFTGSASTGSATQMQIINTPSGTESGTPLAYQLTSNPGTNLSFQPVVEIEDAAGNPVSTDLSPVLLQIAVLSGSGSLSGCSGLENGGYVTFSNCTISASGTYEIYATDNSLPTAPSAQNTCTNDYENVNGQVNCQNSNGIPVALSGQGYSLVFVSGHQPVGGVSGAALTTQPWVEVLNSSTQALCTTCTGTVTLSASGGTLSTASGICTSLPISGGYAKATGCAFAGGYKLVANGNYQATQYVLIATASGDVTGESNAFGVSQYGPATQISFYVQPIGSASSSATSPFLTQTVTIANTTSPNSQAVVALEDSFGNVVVNGDNSVPVAVGITLTTTTSGETLSNCTSTFNNGYFFITGCHGSAYVNGMTLTATGTASSGTKPAAIQSNPFNITGVASKLVFTTQPSAGASGSAFLTMPVIAVEDANNNLVTAAASTSITLTATGGVLQLCTNLTASGGIVSVQNCTFTGSETTTFYLNASITVNGSTATGTSSGFAPNLPGPATQLVFTTQPVGGVAGGALTIQPVIQVQDTSGNLITTSNAAITLTSTSGTLSNCANLTAIGGVVNVTGCTFGGLVGTNYQLVANYGSLTSATSNNFQLSAAGPVSQLVLNINQSGSSCTAGIQYQATCTASATLEDAYGNAESSDTSAITFSISGAGAVTTSGFSQTSGTASETLTGSALGSVSIYASDATDGVTSSTGTFTVLGKNQTITWTAPGAQTWGSSAETLGVAGPTSLGGTGASFPGTAGSTIVTTNTLNNPSSFSASLWFNTSSPGALAGATTSQSSVTPASWDRNIFIDSSGRLVWAINDGGALDEVTSSAVVDNGTWHQVVATYGPAGEDLYLDGALVGSAAADTAAQNYAFYWHIGFGYLQYWPDNQSVPDYFNGSMAQAAIFTSQLTLAQVQTLYGASSAANESTDILALTPSGYWPLTDAAGSLVVADRSTFANTGYLEGTFSLGTASDSANTTVTFASSTPTVCTVSGTLVTAVAIGTCTITPSAPAGGTWALTSGTPTNISIGATNQTFVLTSPSSENWVPGGAGTFTITATDSAGTTVTFASTTTNVCTVSGSTVTMLTTGTCYINPTGPAAGNYLLTTGNPITITINPAVQTITWTPPGSQTWVTGGAGTFSLGTASDSAGTTVTFASSTTSVCTVSGTTVTMLTPGTCTITPTAPAGGSYSTTVGSATNITINKANQTITWTPPGSQTWVAGGAGTFSLGAASDTAGTTVTFASSTTSVCTVSGTTVTMLTAGTCTITPTAPAGGNYATTVGSASNITINGISQTITWTPPGTQTWVAGGAGTFSLGTASDTAGTTVTFASSTTSVCTVSGTTVTMLTAGTCTITPTAPASGGYNTTVGSASNITINKISQTITWTAPGAQTWVPGGAGTFSLGTASDSAGTTVTFASSTTSVCTVSGTTVTKVTAGTCTITPTAPANVDYNQLVGSATNITINPASQTITFTSTAPTRTRSGGPTYTPTATSTSGLGVTISLDGTSTGCSLTGGVVTFTAAGTCRIDANQAGNGNYSAATQVQQSIVVVTMVITQISSVQSTTNGTATLATGSISATSQTRALILISFTSNAATNTCSTPTGASFNTYTLVASQGFYTAGAPYDYMCAYSAIATGTASAVSETLGGTAGNVLTMNMQVVSITGDTGATITNGTTNNGSSTAPVFNLGNTPGATSLEVLFGAVKYAQNGAVPTWSTTAPAGYTELTPNQNTGYPSLISVAYYGTAASSLTGSLANTDPWGTIGIEIQP
jgi:type II secretory pathway pseudopilin PulG